MTEFAVWWDRAFISRDLPTFARKRLNLPKVVSYVSVQFGNDADPVIVCRTAIEAIGIEKCHAVTLLSREKADSVYFGDEATHQFMESVGGDAWWLGDLALCCECTTFSCVLSAEVDGEMLDVVFWGAHAEEAAADIVRALGSQ